MQVILKALKTVPLDGNMIHERLSKSPVVACVVAIVVVVVVGEIASAAVGVVAAAAAVVGVVAAAAAVVGVVAAAAAVVGVVAAAAGVGVVAPAAAVVVAPFSVLIVPIDVSVGLSETAVLSLVVLIFIVFEFLVVEAVLSVDDDVFITYVI